MDNRTTSTLEIKVNAREVNALPRIFRAAFDPRASKELTKSIRDLTGAVRESTTATQGLAAGFQKLANVGESISGIAEVLRESTKEAKALIAELQKLKTSGGGGGGSGGGGGGSGGGGGGGGGGRGFFGGGGGGTQMSQLPMPGIGALAGMMGALPGAGAIAAGSLMAAVSTYSSHLRFQQAQVGAAPFLASAKGMGGYNRRMLNPGSPGGYINPDVSFDALTRFEPGALGGPASSAEQVREEGIRAMSPGFMARMGRKIGTVAPITGALLGMSGNTDAGVGMTGAAAGYVEGVGGAGAMARNYAKATSRTMIPGMAPVYSSPFNAGGHTAAGMRYGLAPGEALSQASGMAQSAGMPVTPETFETGLGARALFGVGLETTGSLAKGLTRAGVTTDQKDTPEFIAKLIGTAVARGLEGSTLGEYLEGTAQLLTQQADMGNVVNMDALLSMEGRTAATLGSTYRGGAIAQSFGKGGAEMGYQGGGGAIDYALMRSIKGPNGERFTGKGGMEEYAMFRGLMQNAGTVSDAMPDFVSQFGGAKGVGPNMRALLVQRAMGAVGGTRVGFGEAERFRDGFAAEGAASPMTAGDIRRRGASVTGALGGSLIAEAGIESERVAIGGQVAGAVQGFERTTNNMAATFENVLGPALDNVAGKIDNWTQALEESTATMKRNGEMGAR